MGATVYDDRPWLARYAEGQPADIEPAHASALAMFQATLRRCPDAVAVHYLDAALTHAELDALSGAFGAALAQRGVARGDRIALYLQNVPEFVVAVLAAWKLGAIAVPVNPMLKEREVRTLLEDCEPVAMVTVESLRDEVASAAVAGTSVGTVVTTAQLQELARAHAGQAPADPGLGPDDVAFLTYTSGTTGPPKGAMNTHGNVVFGSQTYATGWRGGRRRDPRRRAAVPHHGPHRPRGPHLLTGAPSCSSTASTRRSRSSSSNATARPTRPRRSRPSSRSWTLPMPARATLEPAHVVSGGAPSPRATVEEFEQRFGPYIHNIYGLTETTSPCTACRRGRSPVDPTSGALSVGVPVYETEVRLVGDDGGDVAAGEIGELVTRGPQVVPGYWGRRRRPRSASRAARCTPATSASGRRGWFYSSTARRTRSTPSGFKVWPREVEDVLYAHPAVREAAVVGVPDAYRGETVKAYVSLRPGEESRPEELIAFCRRRMAAYKYPRQIEFVDELPRTASGKVLRRVLRDR